MGTRAGICGLHRELHAQSLRSALWCERTAGMEVLSLGRPALSREDCVLELAGRQLLVRVSLRGTWIWVSVSIAIPKSTLLAQDFRKHLAELGKKLRLEGLAFRARRFIADVAFQKRESYERKNEPRIAVAAQGSRACASREEEKAPPSTTAKPKRTSWGRKPSKG
jgi:hypothetical protein